MLVISFMSNREYHMRNEESTVMYLPCRSAFSLSLLLQVSALVQVNVRDQWHKRAAMGNGLVVRTRYLFHTHTVAQLSIFLLFTCKHKHEHSITLQQQWFYIHYLPPSSHLWFVVIKAACKRSSLPVDGFGVLCVLSKFRVRVCFARSTVFTQYSSLVHPTYDRNP
jgi:hypothetical protein